MDHTRPLLPPRRRERFITLAAALMVLIGGLLAVAAMKKAPSVQDAAPTAVPSATPEPGPLTGWVILVDPGHGGYDGGARGVSGIWEKHLNLAVALEVAASLRQRGAEVHLTRESDVDLCEEERPAALTKKRQDMQNRIAMAGSVGANMLLSIHMNEYRAASESGPQVFHRAGSASSRLLAGCLQESLIADLEPPKQRAALAGDYFILQLDIPSVLVECGFISNPTEEAKLRDSAYQARLAEAVAKGVTVYAQMSGQ